MNSAAQRGLTLIEASFVLAIAAILTTSAVAGFGDLRQRRQIEGVAAELASDLQFVRSEAVARNQRLQFSFSTLPTGASCYVIHTGPELACTCAADGAAECVGAAEPIKAVQAPAGIGVTVKDKPSASMGYDPVRGTTSPTATINIARPQGASLRHVVNILGRVRTCSPAGGLPGYRPC
ncbi:MAG: GspH/FimT family pseudopilin [Methylibium sp.]|uniref:GspH/FimT family pseudopilin n=1 Tax=Methylibium sp. TaxID=2067992 RepID=UPI00180D6691|nr:GspH/FimT family pseudopilin [Methylibium sp.]MBA2722881.1 GspH/FimT family pseudopilin [Methylibium sp.]MBA3588770.1 GspH/FimT family pseudopilin [Methylibium sp.]